MARAREEGVELTGEGGLLADLVRQFLPAGLVSSWPSTSATNPPTRRSGHRQQSQRRLPERSAPRSVMSGVRWWSRTLTQDQPWSRCRSSWPDGPPPAASSATASAASATSSSTLVIRIPDRSDRHLRPSGRRHIRRVPHLARPGPRRGRPAPLRVTGGHGDPRPPRCPWWRGPGACWQQQLGGPRPSAGRGPDRGRWRRCGLR